MGGRASQRTSRDGRHTTNNHTNRDILIRFPLASKFCSSTNPQLQRPSSTANVQAPPQARPPRSAGREMGSTAFTTTAQAPPPQLPPAHPLSPQPQAFRANSPKQQLGPRRLRRLPATILLHQLNRHSYGSSASSAQACWFRARRRSAPPLAGRPQEALPAAGLPAFNLPAPAPAVPSKFER